MEASMQLLAPRQINLRTSRPSPHGVQARRQLAATDFLCCSWMTGMKMVSTRSSRMLACTICRMEVDSGQEISCQRQRTRSCSRPECLLDTNPSVQA
ncbi:hypothetical protein CORC01_06545 [Colletotrichum orchidophilum]|uniref:Uncharacterized protein n=1 Tax=Colletotrichum orchidophilum TaxID=1209926 RepID=A0A1G4B9U4_9PEZI|nr:uncharacterized protein CORC01_06545 [Colletotrichum orchidophilum]OHE98177.1 hypothetical protein CORC01_06545 [Colletotrichum orchidophilum]